MTSTIETDIVQPQSGTNTNLQLKPKGTGAVTVSGQAMPTDGGLFTGRSVTINGAMQVSQRGTSESGITTAQYADAPDRWGIQITTAGTWTASQSTTAPDGFSHSYKMDCTTADASLAAGDRLYLYQKIEGQNLQRFAKGSSSAKKYVVSFWVRSTKTGTYICSLWDANNSRQCSQSYSIGSADTWTQISVDFPADTTGAITSDANQGMQLIFYLAAGSTYSSGTLSTTWEASASANRAVGQVNVADSTDNDFYITGIQMEAGDAATPFEFESVGQTLQKCQRYYETSYPVGVTVPTNAQGQGPVVMFAGTETMAGSASIRYSGGRFSVAKRAAPTVAIYSYANSTSGAISSADTTDLAASSGVAIWIGAGGYNMQTNATGTISPVNGGFMWHFAADAEL